MPSGFREAPGLILRQLFQAALDAARPAGKFEAVLPLAPKGRTIVLGAGKAAASMAQAFEAAWSRAGRPPGQGLVVTRYGHNAPTAWIEVAEAAHPVPDAAGLAAAQRILAMAETAGPDDLVVVLMSGGASALLSLPATGVTLADKQSINRALLASGAPIGAMNRVRVALSAVKGGRLAAAAAPARVVTYLVSDVPGDDPATIGSGPTIPTAGTPDEALTILRTHAIPVPEHLAAAIRANRPPGEGVARPDLHMIATPFLSLQAAAAAAREAGLETIILGDALEGEAREVATVMAGIARSVARHGQPLRTPAVLLSGGETTVTVRGQGRGGRNAEFLLALAMQLGHDARYAALAADTDGIDGSEDNAGAWFDGDFLPALVRLGIDPAACLADNDAYRAFAAADRLVVTGPTLTNVNDFRAVLVL